MDDAAVFFALAAAAGALALPANTFLGAALVFFVGAAAVFAAGFLVVAALVVAAAAVFEGGLEF